MAFELTDMHLVSAHRGVWGAQTETTPASLYRFLPDRLSIIEGHDYEAVECATDVASVGPGRLLVPGCDGVLQILDFEPDGQDGGQDRNEGSPNPRLVQERGRIPDSPAGFNWQTVLLALQDEETLVAVNHTAGQAGEELRSLSLFQVSAERSRTILSFDGAHIVDLEAGPGVIALVMENGSGERETAVLKNAPL